MAEVAQVARPASEERCAMKVSKRTWIARDGKRHSAWGFTGVTRADGKKRQVRVFREEWNRETAVREMVKYDWQGTVKAAAQATVTFAQAVARYFEAKARKRSLHRDRIYLRQLQAALGASTPLQEITAAKISAWRDAQLGATSKLGRPFSPAGVNRPLACLRHLLALAVDEWGLLDRAPRIKLVKEDEGRVVWLEPAQEQALLTACKASRNPELHTIVVLAMETGMRNGEVLGLAWSQIDLSRGLIRLQGRQTKSKRSRDIPLRQAAYDALVALAGREGRVFKTRSSRTAFEAAVRRAGLEAVQDTEFTFHGLRHHFASWFMMRGGDLLALQKILGHSSVKITEKYAHLSPDHLRSEMAKTDSASAPPPVVAHGLAHRAPSPELV